MPWRLDHVQLAIPPGAEDRCDEFYVSLLGFRVLTKPPLLAARGGRWYQRDALIVHLGVQMDFVPATKAHPAFVVDGYDELLEILAAQGIETRPDASIPATRRCHLEDPVGNRLELIDGASPH